METRITAQNLIEEDTSILPLVYFISAEERTRFPIKIGRSTTRSIGRRLGSMQTGMPYRLNFLMVIEAPPEAELKIHRAFAHLRLEGEWFKPARDLMQFIHGLEQEEPAWRTLTGPRFKFAPGNEPPPDDPMDIVRYGMTTEELHWERTKLEMRNRMFPKPTFRTQA